MDSVPPKRIQQFYAGGGDEFLEGLTNKIAKEIAKGDKIDHHEGAKGTIIDYFSYHYPDVDRFHEWVESVAEWYAKDHHESNMDNWAHAEEIAALYIMKKINVEEDYPTCPLPPGS